MRREASTRRSVSRFALGEPAHARRDDRRRPFARRHPAPRLPAPQSDRSGRPHQRSVAEDEAQKPSATAVEADQRLTGYLAGIATAMAVGLLCESRGPEPEDVRDTTLTAEEQLAQHQLLDNRSRRRRETTRRRATPFEAPLLRRHHVRRSREGARPLEELGKPPPRARDRRPHARVEAAARQRRSRHWPPPLMIVFTPFEVLSMSFDARSTASP